MSESRTPTPPAMVDKETCQHSGDWVPTYESYKTSLPDYPDLVLTNVPGLYCADCELVEFPLPAIVRAEQEFLAREFSILPEEISKLMLLLHARQSRPKGTGIIATRFHFHKDLFYLQKGLEQLGYEDAFIVDRFKPDWNGPTAIHLIGDTEDLAGKGLIHVSAMSSPRTPTEEGYLYRIEQNAVTRVEKLVRNLPPVVDQVAEKVIKEINSLKYAQLLHKVHTEYPLFWKYSPE